MFPARRHSDQKPTSSANDSRFPSDAAHEVTNKGLLKPLLHTLDEVDYGLLLLDANGQLMHANRQARQELNRHRLLGLRGTEVYTIDPLHRTTLAQALEKASRGQRQLVTLITGTQSLTVACLPLSKEHQSADAGFGNPGVLLILQRASPACQLSIGIYARAHGLTRTEELVLRALCSGFSGPDIAAAHCVTEATVRTQMRALREKTRTHSIRQLVQHVSTLPPMALQKAS